MKTPDNAARQTQDNLQRAFPEIGAGGFSRVDGTVSFYTRINALARPDMTVLDLGAGRGGQIHDADTPFLKNLLTLKGKVSSLHGADVDPVVEQNPFIDQAHIIVPDEPLPFKQSVRSHLRRLGVGACRDAGIILSGSRQDPEAEWLVLRPNPQSVGSDRYGNTRSPLKISRADRGQVAAGADRRGCVPNML